MEEKRLKDMTLEELWVLFPIILEDHREEYKVWYKEQEVNIINALGKKPICRINHIGSTAVKGLVAKPTVDILLEIKDDVDVEDILKRLEEDGWLKMHEANMDNEDMRVYFNKGYTEQGFADKVFHLHVGYKKDWNELYFRDYLNAHDDVAKAYGDLKLGLVDKYKNNRDGYTDAKTVFIKKYTELAKDEFGGRY